MQDEPTPTELIKAVADFLRTEIAPAIKGYNAFKLRVGINALAAVFYPTELRSFGIGAGLGVGRLGAIVGPLIGGQLMALQWSSRELFLAADRKSVV